MTGFPRPTAKKVLLCDDVVYDSTLGKPSVLNIFNTIRVPADQAFPYRIKKFGVFAAMRDGLGSVNVYVQFVRTSDMRVVRQTQPVVFDFPSRAFTVYAVLRFADILIPGPETYFVEMYCDDELIDDQPLQIVHG
jgi:hypothetical protein